MHHAHKHLQSLHFGLFDNGLDLHRNDTDETSSQILANITEWSDGTRFIVKDTPDKLLDIGHINEALREVLKFEAPLPSSETPVVVSWVATHLEINQHVLPVAFIRYSQRHTTDSTGRQPKLRPMNSTNSSLMPLLGAT